MADKKSNHNRFNKQANTLIQIPILRNLTRNDR